MKKRLCAVFVLSSVLAAGLCIGSPRTLNAYAQGSDSSETEQEQKADYEYTVQTDDTLLITKCNLTGTSVKIPEAIDGKTVTAVGEYAFDSITIKSINIPACVTKIAQNGIGYLAPESASGTAVKNTGLKFICHEGSAAEDYAYENGFTASITRHKYTLTSETDATCTKAGYQEYTCSVCNDSYQIASKPLGHSYTVKGKTVKPTLKAKGYTVYKCSRCGKTTKKNYVAKLKNVSKVKVTGVKASYVYTGKKIKPAPTLKYGKTKLKKGTDYTIKYSNIINKGTAKITIKGKGKYGGTKTIKYKIKAASIKKVKVKGFKSYFSYTGSAKKQSVKLTYKGKTLKKGKDYTISYKNNTAIGTAKLVIKGKGNFSKTLTKKYNIVRTGWYTADDNNVYYYNSKGKLCTDVVTKIDGSYYCFDTTSKMVKGWRYIGGSYYLFDRISGKRVEGKTVDGITLGSDGKAVTNDWALSKIETMMRARNIMLDITNTTDTMEAKRLKCFNWILSFPYHRYRLLKPIYKQAGWEMPFANDIFIEHQGCCVSESSALAFLFREIGYTDVAICHDTGHSWVTIGNVLYDPVFAEGKDFDSNYNVLPYDYRKNPVDRRVIG